MAAIDQIANVSITQTTPSIATTSFAFPLIMGTSTLPWPDFVHSYTSPSQMLTDSFLVSSPEYIEALAMFNGAISPSQFYVGKRSATAAQVDTFTVNTLTTGRGYTLTINGTVLTYTAQASDTQQSILTQLGTKAAAAAPVTSAVTGTGGTASLALTATSPGQAITYTAIDSQLTRVATTAANGIVGDIINVQGQNNAWYGILTPGASDSDILQLAAWVESNAKIYFPLSVTSAIGTSATTDVASALKAAAYKRTALFFSPAGAASYPEATWVGTKLPQVPGSNNYAFATLPGQVPDAFTGNQVGILIGNPLTGTAGKNVNIYQQIAGVNVTQTGTTASGQFIDITIGLDWLRTTIQTNIFALLASGQKVPYTNRGVTMLIGCVDAAIQQGIANTLIDGTTTYSVTAPDVLTVPASQRANRIAPTITFACRLQGAVNSVNVAGVISL